MRAVVFDGPGRPLRLEERPLPEPGPGQVRLAVRACGVCRTDLHVLDGELTEPALPLVLGHQVVGVVDALGPGVERFVLGQRVGVPWLGGTCGACRQCARGRENLCRAARFTGYHLDGGYAEACVAQAEFTFPLPEGPDDAHAAPWLCAGLIGYRCLRQAGEAEHLGLYGFGAAAHLVAQVARHQGRAVYAFTRPGDEATQRFARERGCAWAGGSDEAPPVELDAALVFAPVGALVPAALRAVGAGGTVVCGGIHMTDIPSFPYSILWEERRVVSVANLTRRDAQEFLPLAASIPLESTVRRYALGDAAQALKDLRAGRFEGSAVLVP